MAELITGLRAQTVRENLERLRKEIAQAVARRPPGAAAPGTQDVEILAATKYVALGDPPLLAEAGIQDLFHLQVDGVDADRLGLAGKPDPAIFVEAARRLEVDPRRASVVEDASKLPNLTAELLRRGMTEADVRKVLGENLLRVLELR